MRAAIEETGASRAQPLLDLLFEDPHAGRCLVAPDGRVQRVSGEWLRATGLARDDVLGATITDLFPEQREALLALCARAREGHRVLCARAREGHRVLCARAREGHRVVLPRQALRIGGGEGAWEGSVDPVAMEGGTGLLISTRETARELHGAGAVLGASDARFRTVADESPVILWVTDVRGANEFVNRSYCEFFGVTHEEAEGTRWRPLVHPDDAPKYEREVVAAIRERQAFSAEARVRRTDGEWRWIAARAHPRSGPAGEFLGHVGIALDITDRKCAEEALRRSEQKFRASVANAATGFALATREGRFLEANPAYCAITGYGIEELRSMTFEELIAPDDRAANMRQIERMLAGEISDFVVENRYRRKTGEVVWVRKSTSVVRDSSGAPEWIIALVEDITERKQAEVALRATLQRFYDVLSSMYSAVLLVREDGRIEFVNPALCRLLHLPESPEELVGLNAPELLGRFKLAYLRPEEETTRIEEIVRQGRPVKGEEIALRDGRTCLRDFVPLAVDGEPCGRLWLLFDITERKRAEEALREEDRRKAEFLAVLSHELRNPLAPIRNSIYLLDRSAPGTEQATRARDVIRRQTEHLTRLVDDLLDSTRISRGKIVLQRTRVDLRDVVRRTTDDLRSTFAQSGVELHVECSPLPVWIRADPTRMTQVLGNLLQNAVKFTPAGGTVTVTIAAEGDHAELGVRDTGVGMEPGTVAHMFEPFAQAERSLARTKGGLGLGLPLVKGLVELHGGSVEARSGGIGQGSEFHVRLPLDAAGAEAGREPHVAAGASPREVLVIEDNLDAGATLAEILELQGHRARVARDGRSGLELARALHPEVVLCDIGLPDIDGYELARELRRDLTLRDTRLVALSGYAQPEDRQRAQDAGFDAHLAKPPSIDELMSVLGDGGSEGALRG